MLQPLHSSALLIFAKSTFPQDADAELLKGHGPCAYPRLCRVAQSNDA